LDQSSVPPSLNADQLSDDALCAELEACVAVGRENDVRVLVYLMAVEERGLYLQRACSSMYDFCKRKLRFSDGQTYRRLMSARLAKRYPFLLPLIASGATHMSTLAQIKRFVTADNVHSLVAETAGKNRDEVDRVLARRFGVERTPLSSRGMILIDEELEGLIQRSFELECHAVPDGDRLKLAKRAFRSLIARAEKNKRATAERPRPAPTNPTKTIPRASTRAMFEKHGDQCSFVDPSTGERCGSRIFIQRNHRRMRVHGGTHDADNLDPHCGPHNRFLAALALGRERIQRAIRLRQQMRGGDEVDAPTGE
jgi:hypothetical protein